MRTADRQRGFTLVEMVVTVFVLIVLAGVVVPAPSRDTDRKLDLLQMQIQDAIDHSRALAYHTGQKMGVLFSTSGNWLAVVNELGVPFEDPLTRRWYVIDFDAPDQPGDIHIEHALFGAGRPIIGFDTKGELIYPGEVRIRAGEGQRWFSVNTATGKLVEKPIGT